MPKRDKQNLPCQWICFIQLDWGCLYTKINMLGALHHRPFPILSSVRRKSSEMVDIGTYPKPIIRPSEHAHPKGLWLVVLIVEGTESQNCQRYSMLTRQKGHTRCPNQGLDHQVPCIVGLSSDTGPSIIYTSLSHSLVHYSTALHMYRQPSPRFPYKLPTQRPTCMFRILFKFSMTHLMEAWP